MLRAYFLLRCPVPQGLKHSVIYDFGVVVLCEDKKSKYFFCMANHACCVTKSKYKMSNGCTSGPTEHLLSRHGIRAQKSVMVENTRAQLLGGSQLNALTQFSRIRLNNIPNPAKLYRIRPNYTEFRFSLATD